MQRYRRDEGVQKIETYAARQAAILLIQERKAQVGNALVRGMYEDLIRHIDGFMGEVQRRVEASGRTDRMQALFEAACMDVLKDYVQDAKELTMLGTDSIKRVVYEVPPMPVDDRRGVLRRMWDDLFAGPGPDDEYRR